MARKPSNRPRGRPSNVPVVPPEAIADAALTSSGSRELSAETGIGEKTAREIMRATRMTAEEFAEHQRGRLQAIAEKLAKQAERDIGKLTPMQTVISLGIVTDKANQAPKALNQSLHLHIKGDAGSALSAILGPAAKSVFGATANPGNMSEPVKIQPGKGETIDVETAQQA